MHEKTASSKPTVIIIALHRTGGLRGLFFHFFLPPVLVVVHGIDAARNHSVDRGFALQTFPPTAGRLHVHVLNGMVGLRGLLAGGRLDRARGLMEGSWEKGLLAAEILLPLVDPHRIKRHRRT